MNNMEEKEERKETGIRIKGTRLAGAREQSSEDLCSPDFLRNIEHAHGLKYRSD